MREREIAYRPAFLRDVKRLKRRHYNMGALKTVIRAVAERHTDWLGQHRDNHTGNLVAYRELHTAVDWLLLYVIDADGTLALVSTGSHDEFL
ncbi:MAG: type II toxin-antitoxin system YafQ family toxin [Actinomycetaceae bacterium]|nr:type II toxin-antitoxin system YafQ family toxin [Actinomycetaceae bacterium]